MTRMSTNKTRLAGSAAALCMALISGCGGGAGTGSAPARTLGGVAVDGYLQGATVYLDLNRNAQQDAGEPSTTTDVNGRYTLDYSSVVGPITGLPVVVVGGVDADTGFAFTGRLSAPVDKASQAQVVTPLTTLVDGLVSQGLAADVAAARQQVAGALGLTVDQLASDPVALMVSQPGIYTTSVALQRTIQLLAHANARPGESAHDSQERTVRALAVALSAQTSRVDIPQLLAGLALQNTAQAQELASAISRGVQAGLQGSGHAGAKAVLKAMDEIRVRMESDHQYDLASAADKIDRERGKTTSRPYHSLAKNSGSAAAVANISNLHAGTGITLLQPSNTAGRLLASNCFQCHGTGGSGGFDKIRGSDAAEIRAYLSRPANSSIMAAHAQGYTAAQLDALIAYLKQ